MPTLRDLYLDGKSVFVKSHVSTLEGSAPRSLKKLLASIWNSNRARIYENLQPIEIRHQFKYLGCSINLYEEKVIFRDMQNQEITVLKISRVGDISLKEFAAASVSSELGSAADIQLIIKQGLCPAHLKDVLVKYV